MTATAHATGWAVTSRLRVAQAYPAAARAATTPRHDHPTTLTPGATAATPTPTASAAATATIGRVESRRGGGGGARGTAS